MADEAGRWVRAADAARILNVSERTVRRWATEGRLRVDRSVRPYLVMVTGQMADVRRQPTGVADAMATELEGLRAENDRLRERIRELVQERDYLRMLAGTLATGQQKMIEATPRRWRWPWQRREP